MNRIVREHYPVEKLPEDLRVGFQAGALVRISVEVEPRKQGLTDERSRARAATELLEARARLQPSPDDSVSRVSTLRDEWDR